MEPTPPTHPVIKDRTSLVSSSPRAFPGPARLWVVAAILACSALSYAAGVHKAVSLGREAEFAQAYNAWTPLRTRDLKTGTSGADSIRLWRVVKARFRDLDKSLDY